MLLLGADNVRRRVAARGHAGLRLDTVCYVITPSSLRRDVWRDYRAAILFGQPNIAVIYMPPRSEVRANYYSPLVCSEVHICHCLPNGLHCYSRPLTQRYALWCIDAHTGRSGHGLAPNRPHGQRLAHPQR